jgi:hypothetical protein
MEGNDWGVRREASHWQAKETTQWRTSHERAPSIQYGSGSRISAIRYHAYYAAPTHGHLSPDVRRPLYHQTYGLKTVRASDKYHETL